MHLQTSDAGTSGKNKHVRSAHTHNPHLQREGWLLVVNSDEDLADDQLFGMEREDKLGTEALVTLSLRG